ncbi:hypothetical protein GOQ27_10625 [Clostridium sp. D2Q-11]|uniref:DUF4181 domain-containing protein n=1 Tax=Anaeromonas frigoriresistens TaxID=2683708 RepID=A0A942V2S8_9FIRM|nr:hypothetical protein [Anaeromonas frigoriresistens]MBS4538922.1 hypothetical protein [Anaeromonas frigoriresistens]
MEDLNYFSTLCFAWAFVGIGSRILMIRYGKKWIDWELDKAYAKEKPKWIYIVSVISLIIVGYTWYQVFNMDIKYSWIIAILVSLTLIKIFNLIFNYDKFREFVDSTLNNKRKFKQLNISVFIFSIIFILMGIFLY